MLYAFNLFCVFYTIFNVGTYSGSLEIFILKEFKPIDISEQRDSGRCCVQCTVAIFLLALFRVVCVLLL